VHLDSCITTIAEVLQSRLPTEWEGRASILEMRDAGYGQWKQMEWIGWYFQYLCNRYLAGYLEIPGPKYGNASLMILVCPLGLQAHVQTGS
jgi:hypothetical protein